MTDSRQCTSCFEEKKLTEFYTRYGKTRAVCKQCDNFTRRDTGEPKKNPFEKLDEATRTKIKDLLAAGVKLVQIASETKIDRRSLGYWQKKGYIK